MSQLAAGTTPAETVIDGMNYITNGTTPFQFAGLSGSSGSSGTGPKAYLNWLVFDNNFVLVNGGYKRMTTAAKEAGTNVLHEKLSDQVIITQPGYVYVYLSNEETTPMDVYFDDFMVTHARNLVIQADDYYPFGLTFNSYSRENSVPNKWKFQGQEHVDDLGLNWDSFKWRNHQPEIGRFFGIDKLSEKYYANSPYAFSENKVIAHRELEGLESAPINQNSDPMEYMGMYFQAAGSEIDNAFVSVSVSISNIIGQVKVNLGIAEATTTTAETLTNTTEARTNLGELFQNNSNGFIASPLKVTNTTTITPTSTTEVKTKAGQLDVKMSATFSSNAATGTTSKTSEGQVGKGGNGLFMQTKQSSDGASRTDMGIKASEKSEVGKWTFSIAARAGVTLKQEHPVGQQ